MDKNYRERRNTENTITNFLNGKHIIKDSFYMEVLMEKLKDIGFINLEKTEKFLKEIKEAIEKETWLKVNFCIFRENLEIELILNGWHYNEIISLEELRIWIEGYPSRLIIAGLIQKASNIYLNDKFYRKEC